MKAHNFENLESVGGNLEMDITKEKTIDQIIEEQINIQFKEKSLTSNEMEYLKKFTLFIEEGLSLVSYAAAIRYINPSLVYLLNKNLKNALSNPFIKLFMTLEDSIYKVFILSFANLFLLNSPEKDTFSIRSLFSELAKKQNGKIVFSIKYPSILVKDDISRKSIESVYTFFEDKNNKQIFSKIIEIRNHIVAHPTTKGFNYSDLPTNLNQQIEFLILAIEKLHHVIGIKQYFDIGKFYKEEMYRWAFFYENVKKHGEKFLSDNFTNELLSAFEIGKSKTTW